MLPAHAELSPRPDWVPAWTDLSPMEQRVYARYMEAFAAFLSHTDHELGRLLDRLDVLGELDDTVVVVLSDNGASSEGGPTGSVNDVRVWNALPRTVEEADERLDEIGGPRIHNNYPWGWTVAGNTPFRRWKRETHEGGVADPLIVHWPAGISARGEVRTQYVHAIDLAPTLLDVIGISPPAVVGGVAQRPLDGVSFAATFADADAPEVHTTQYYEMFGCRALYHDGLEGRHLPRDPGRRAGPRPGACGSSTTCGPTRRSATTSPPPSPSASPRWSSAGGPRPSATRCCRSTTARSPSSSSTGSARWRRDRRTRTGRGGHPVPESVAVNVRGRAHTITAHLAVPPDLPVLEGVLAVQGSVLGGWSFHLLADGRLCYVHNLAGLAPLPGRG